MGGISTSLVIKDRFTNTINRGTVGIDRMLKSMKALDITSIKLNPARAFNSFANAANLSNARLQAFIQKQNEAAKGAGKVKSAWSKIPGFIKSAVAAFGAKQIIDLSDQMTSTTARLNLMNDGNQTTDELSNKIMASAQRSRASYLDTAAAIAKLGLNASAAFSSNDETIAFMEQVNKLFVVGGASAQEQSNAMTQLTQAMAAGALRGEELNSILDAGPGIARAIEKYMGIAEGQIKSVAEQGLVTADVVKNALFAAAEDTNAKFESMPKTCAQVWKQIKNSALSAFSGILERINGFLNSDAGTAIVSGIVQGISLLSSAVSWLIEAITWVGNAVISNWGIIEPVLIVAGAILAAWAATLIPGLITKFMLMTVKLWAMVPPILAQAAGWLAVNWPILVVFLAIAAIIIILRKMGVTFDQVIGFIGGLIGGFTAYMHNNVAAIYNYWVSFVEFFANCFNHPVYSIKKLFVNLANSVLDLVKSIASAIDAVFGSNLAGGVQSLQSQMEAWVGEMPDGYKVINKMEMKSIEGAAKRGYDTGANIGAGIADTLGGLFSMGTSDPFGVAGTDGLAGVLDGANLGSIGEVGKIKNDVNIADEDIKLMKDVAEMRYVQNFVTLTPTVAQHIGTVNQNADVDYLVNETARVLMDEVAAEAEGYYN